MKILLWKKKHSDIQVCTICCDKKICQNSILLLLLLCLMNLCDGKILESANPVNCFNVSFHLKDPASGNIIQTVSQWTELAVTGKGYRRIATLFNSKCDKLIANSCRGAFSTWSFCILLFSSSFLHAFEVCWKVL